jgi:hypothetical protein
MNIQIYYSSRQQLAFQFLPHPKWENNYKSETENESRDFQSQTSRDKSSPRNLESTIYTEYQWDKPVPLPHAFGKQQTEQING